MKIELKEIIIIKKLIKWIGILLVIITFFLLITQIRKIYVMKNTYKKYETSVEAKIIDSKVISQFRFSRTRGRRYYRVVYTVYIKETGETIKLEDSSTSNVIAYNDQQKVLLNYYNLYYNNSDKYYGKSYSIKPLSYFKDGSFFGVDSNEYIFYDSEYINKIVNFKIDSSDTMIDKEYIYFHTSVPNDTCKLSKINEELINVIKNKNVSISVEDTMIGKIYNFNDYFNYSVLNYGNTINESLVLKSIHLRNIADFISNID